MRRNDTPFGHSIDRPGVGSTPTIPEMIEEDPSLIEDARDHVATMDLPGTPDLRHARIIAATSLPHWCGARKVLELSIRDGEPQHGEKRSDDHVTSFTVRAPLADIGSVDVCSASQNTSDSSPEANVVDATQCPEDGCFATNAVFGYASYHHIAGSEVVECDECDHTYYREDWG